jgi:hypothetical protein
MKMFEIVSSTIVVIGWIVSFRPVLRWFFQQKRPPMEIIDYLAEEEARKQSRRGKRELMRMFYSHLPNVDVNPMVEQQVARFVDQLDATRFDGYRV